MSTGVVIGKRGRVANSVTMLVLGIATAGFVAASVAVPNAPILAGLGLLYGLVLAGFIGRIARRGGREATMVASLAVVLFVLMLALMASLPETHRVEGVLLSFGVALISGATLALHRDLADR